MAYEGYIDEVSQTGICGWVFDSSFPDQSLSVEIVEDGNVISTVCADKLRTDLIEAGKGNGLHAFEFNLPKRVATSTLMARVAGKRWYLQHGDVRLQAPMRFDRRLAHSLEYGFPHSDAGFTKATPGNNEIEIVNRLIEAFNRANKDDPFQDQTKTDLWELVNKSFHGEIIAMMRKRDLSGVAGLVETCRSFALTMLQKKGAKGVAAYMRDAHAKGITWGITQGPFTTEALQTDPEVRKLVLTQYLDNLASLAEYIGVSDIESPEQAGQWGENLHADPQQVLKRISAAIGIQAVPPQSISFLFGIKVKEGIIAGRDLGALYAALRLQTLFRESDSKSGICEIGGGFGGVAYYSHLLGLRPFTIIDLPLINLLQGYYLLRSLPQAKIQLYGEPEIDADIRLMPTYCFDRDQTQYDLLLNQDSIPEMHADYARAYLQAARSRVKYGFLSINQEARAPQAGAAKQSVVRDLVKEVGGYRQIYRTRHWINPGYTEEFYRL